MSTREKLAWLLLFGCLAMATWLGWLLFGHWPDTSGFEVHHHALTLPVEMLASLLMVVYSLAYHWRRGPLDDERDRQITGAAAGRGFIALIVFNLLAGVTLAHQPGLLAHLGPVWIRYCLLWMVLVAAAVHGAWQVRCYRRD